MSSNPLAMYMRQPKIYIRLPSNGNFWPAGTIEVPENGEFPVFSMTAKDELALKVPDALLNGQAVVDVIQSCIPNIKNAWSCPSLDLDTILIAIRLATYGEMMTVPVKFGKLEQEYQVDLRIILDSLLQTVRWDNVISVNENLTVFVKPLTYKHITRAAIQSFETQKLVNVVNDEKISEDEKIKIFRESFAKLTTATLETIIDSIDKIESISGSTNNHEHIKEFIENVDKEVYSKIEHHLQMLRENNNVKPMKIAVTPEMVEEGITSDFVEVPITFDPSTFFV